MEGKPPAVRGVIESAIYVEDVQVSQRFYEEVLGLGVLSSSDRLSAMSVADRQVLLLFRRGGSTSPLETTGGTIPPHDSQGETHFALAIAPEDFEGWRQRLESCAVPIESEVEWTRGGRSLYFRDPDGHLVELATPGIWAIY